MQQNPLCELSIVMPCLNEEMTVGICIKKALRFLELNHVLGEVVVADNGSTDKSREIARDAGARVVDVPEKGYGCAIHGGVLNAKGAFVVIGDADDSYDFLNLLPFLHALREGADLVMGNRFKGGIEKKAMPWLHRYVGNPVLSGIGRVFFRIPVRDFHCGLRAIRKEAYIEMDLKTEGMEFASEMVIKASLLHMKIVEVPTRLAPDGRDRPPHLRTWRDGWRHLRFLLLYSPRWLFFYPGVLLVIFGAFLTVILSLKRVEIAGVSFDVHTLLYSCLMIVVGLQFISFYLLARMFGTIMGLLPRKRNFDRLVAKLTIERGIILAGILLLLGLGITVYAVLSWAAGGFGPLDPVYMLRRLIPATSLIVLGCNIGLTSFLLGFFSAGEKHSTLT